MSIVETPLLSDFAPTDELLSTLLDLSVAGVVYYTPISNSAGHLTDFAFSYLNRTAQAFLALPAKPTQTYLQRFPQAVDLGLWDWLCEVYQTGGPSEREIRYQSSDFASYYRMALQRVGPGLLVSFTTVSPQEQASLSEAWREIKAREQTALMQARQERALLHAVLAQAPVAIGLFQGDEQVVRFANQPLCAMWGCSPEQVQGRPLLESVPELQGQEFAELIAEVGRTRTPFVGTEQPAQLRQHDQLETHYFNFVYQPLYDEVGDLLGVLDIAIDVTEQVLVQHQLQQLNQELEARVQERTQQVEAALREAEQQRQHALDQHYLLGQILRQVPASIATLSGSEHRYSFFNNSYRQLTANRAQLGLSVADVVPETVDQGFVALLNQVYQTGQPFIGRETPLQLQHPVSGQFEQRYIDFIYQALTDGLGQTQGVLAFIVDVTPQVVSRQRAEALQAELLTAAQRSAQERQNLYWMFEQAPMAILLLRDANHRIEYFNPACERLFSGRQLQDRTIAECQPEAVEQGFVALLDHVYQTGQTYTGTELPFDIMQPNGTSRTHYFSFTYQTYREQSQVAGISVFMYDVTEQVLARRRRETQQEELQRLFEQAPVAVAIMRGPELVVELANSAMEVLWGRPAEQVIGHPYFEALPDVAGQGYEEILANVLRKDESFFITEAPVTLNRAHTGLPTQAYVNFVFQPLHDEQEAAYGLMALGVEVTGQVLARQQVQQLNNELSTINQELHDSNVLLKRTNADLDNFVYAASHDLKAPIANIEGLLHALRQDLPAPLVSAPPISHLLDLMDGAVSRFQKTIGHLTNITQLQQVNDGPVEVIDLAPLIDGVCLDLAATIASTAAQVTVTITECPHMRFAPQNLRSIIFNLLSNAIKYHAPDRASRVHLHTTCTDQHVVLSVQDNGMGLSQQEQGKLFVLFKRLHPHIEGSGVGLYAVKKIIENAGGTITVESELGIGTKFTVSLPRLAEPH